MARKILVIDDEANILFAFKTHLSDEGHEVFTAEGYRSALDIISRTDLDVIIADIILGDHTGMDILQAVKSKGMYCPVIMITGAPNVKTAADAVRLGAFDYLSKPIQRDKLLHVTNQALQLKGLLDEKKHLEVDNDRYRRNLEAIFASINEAIITVDNDMRVIEANGAASIICGFSPREAIGDRFDNITNQCFRSCRNVLKDTLKSKDSVREFRIECRHSSRPRQVVLVSSSPLTDQGNSYIGAVLVVRDITKLADLELELKKRNQFHNIIGRSKKMQDIFRLLDDLAQTETSVLITGETGTGKGLVAKAIHYESSRSDMPFVTLNCSTLAENLLESELFGHVKGAYTGAVSNKMGRFQMADGGTIFLDEIGDISPIIQLKILRVLQERDFEQVGDSTPIKVDVRVIAATNRDLRKKVQFGEFRHDLYYRLKVVEVAIPPLRERYEDIPLLVDHFCKSFNKGFKKDIGGISNDVLNIFMNYHWPGNIRELEHAMEHAFVLCHDQSITIDHLPAEMRNISLGKIQKRRPKPVDESQEIVQALNKTGWNKTKAARLLGMSRPSMYKKMRKFEITRPDDQDFI